MNIKNINPSNEPIQFKIITHQDFEGYDIGQNDYLRIEADEKGYISDFIREYVDLQAKNTTVINASVGQGKTTALMNIVERYYKNTDYIIFLIAPFKSLITQYSNLLQKKGLMKLIFLTTEI